MRIISFFLFSFSIFSLPISAKPVLLSSPDKNIVFSIDVNNKGVRYILRYKGKTLIDQSPLNLRFNNGSFDNNLKGNKPVFRDTTEDYDLVVGKTKHVQDEYKEVTIPIQQTTAPYHFINIVVRAFNDGVPFRYEFPRQSGWDNLVLKDEQTTFNFHGNPKVRTLFHPAYVNSHEGLYRTLSLSDIKADTLMDMPALFEFANNVYVAITEAALVDYAGMYLVKHDGVLRSELCPLPGRPLLKVKSELPHKSRWRVVMIGDRVGSLIESNILTSLNEPCKIKDVSWLRPGKTTFPGRMVILFLIP